MRSSCCRLLETYCGQESCGLGVSEDATCGGGRSAADATAGQRQRRQAAEPGGVLRRALCFRELIAPRPRGWPRSLEPQSSRGSTVLVRAARQCFPLHQSMLRLRQVSGERRPSPPRKPHLCSAVFPLCGALDKSEQDAAARSRFSSDAAGLGRSPPVTAAPAGLSGMPAAARRQRSSTGAALFALPPWQRRRW